MVVVGMCSKQSETKRRRSVWQSSKQHSIGEPVAGRHSARAFVCVYAARVRKNERIKLIVSIEMAILLRFITSLACYKSIPCSTWYIVVCVWVCCMGGRVHDEQCETEETGEWHVLLFKMKRKLKQNTRHAHSDRRQSAPALPAQKSWGGSSRSSMTSFELENEKVHRIRSYLSYNKHTLCSGLYTEKFHTEEPISVSSSSSTNCFPLYFIFIIFSFLSLLPLIYIYFFTFVEHCIYCVVSVCLVFWDSIAFRFRYCLCESENEQKMKMKTKKKGKFDGGKNEWNPQHKSKSKWIKLIFSRWFFSPCVCVCVREKLFYLCMLMMILLALLCAGHIFTAAGDSSGAAE